MPTAISLPVFASRSLSPRPGIDQRVRAVLQMIQSTPSYDVTRLARTVGLSNSRISHLFKRETGQDLRSILTHYRLDKAAELLQDAEAPVKEVSYIVGYRHTASFNRAFRKKFGCAPQQYRNEQQVRKIADPANRNSLTRCE
jgi:AraC-like DNA-binding protein